MLLAEVLISLTLTWSSKLNPPRTLRLTFIELVVLLVPVVEVLALLSTARSINKWLMLLNRRLESNSRRLVSLNLKMSSVPLQEISLRIWTKLTKTFANSSRIPLMP